MNINANMSDEYQCKYVYGRAERSQWTNHNGWKIQSAFSLQPLYTLSDLFQLSHSMASYVT